MGQTPSIPLLEKANCPRCGYDLRGVVEAWSESSPIAGTCTECGLDFDWGEVLHPEVHQPAWCVEFAPTVLKRLRAVGRTMEMALRPRRFWTELKMIHPVRLRRLVGLWVVLVLALYLVFAGVQGLRCAAGVTGYGGTTASVITSSLKTVALPFSDTPLTNPTIGSRRRSYIVHPRRLSMSFLGDLPTGYKLQNALMLTIGLPVSTTISIGQYDRDFFNVLVLWGIALLMGIIAPFGFLLLPTTRHDAQVRSVHLVRIAAYSFVFHAALLFYALVHAGLLWLGWLDFSGWGPYFTVIRILCLFATPFWLVWWWRTAIRHYLRMPHALGIAAAIVLIAFLLGPVGVLALTFLEM